MRLKKKLMIVICWLIILMGLFLIKAKVPSSEVITTELEEVTNEFIYDSIKKTYEISSRSLEKGFTTSITEKEAFRIFINEKAHTFVIWNISKTELIMLMSGKRSAILLIGESGILDINNDGKFDLEFKLMDIQEKRATINIKSYKEEIPEVTYKELFDIEVELIRSVIYSAQELDMFIRFINFGEGPSQINIIYTILDENNNEVYTGIDTKIVYTEESLIKNFGFLDLSKGKYKITSKVIYGQNQSAESEKDFEIKQLSFFEIVQKPFIFVLGILALLILVNFLRKNYRTRYLFRKSAEKEIMDIKREV